MFSCAAQSCLPIHGHSGEFEIIHTDVKQVVTGDVIVG